MKRLRLLLPVLFLAVMPLLPACGSPGGRNYSGTYGYVQHTWDRHAWYEYHRPVYMVGYPEMVPGRD